MLFRQLFDTESSTFTYLLAEDFGGRGILIDPVKSRVAQYVQLIKELEITLESIVDTHVHADHVTGSGLLAQQLHCDTWIGQGQSTVENVSGYLQDNQILKAGTLCLQALYTPGHTDDSFCFYTTGMVFTGDLLLIRGTGRADFQNGDAGVQYDSLQRILQLPEATLIYPGHDYKGMTVSSVREEKRYNPRLQGKSKSQYIEIMNHLNLSPPKQLESALALNLKNGIE